jgi:hypothetical protein
VHNRSLVRYRFRASGIVPFAFISSLLLSACISDSALAPTPDASDAALRLSSIAAETSSLPPCNALQVSATSLEPGTIATYTVPSWFPLRGRNGKPLLQSSNESVVSVLNYTQFKGLEGGTAVLTISGPTCSDAVTISVNAPAPVVTPANPVSSIAVQAVRDGAGFGFMDIVSGIPLRQGALFPAGVANVRLVIDGKVIPSAVRALSGRYRDGSLRAVGLKTKLLLGETPLQGSVEIMPTPVPQEAWTTTAASTAAAVLPTSPAYLLSTGFFGSTVTVAGTLNRQYEDQFVSNADRFWAVDGATWGNTNYYDRVQNHFVYWARSGDAKWFFRAAAIARDYRKGYIEANGYMPSPHWAQMEGLALHHWLTADDASALAVVRSASRLTGAFTPSYVVGIEGRIAARMILMSLLSWELGDQSENWPAKLDSYVNGVVASQLPDGSFAWPNWCNGQANFMAGMQNDALIKSYERYRADSRIPTSVRSSINYMWNTQWSALAGSFRYAAKSCGDLPEYTAGEFAPDLNGLILRGFAFMAKFDGSADFRVRTDAIALSMIQNAWLNGSKQFNQAYYDTHVWMGYR